MYWCQPPILLSLSLKVLQMYLQDKKGTYENKNIAIFKVRYATLCYYKQRVSNG
jgi:hypothetical protein